MHLRLVPYPQTDPAHWLRIYGTRLRNPRLPAYLRPQIEALVAALGEPGLQAVQVYSIRTGTDAESALAFVDTAAQRMLATLHYEEAKTI
jgi:hypothetical protein